MTNDEAGNNTASFNLTQEGHAVAVYPNPFASEVNVLLPENHAYYKAELVDGMGRILDEKSIKDGRGFSLEVKIELPNGLYFIQLYSDQNKEVFKVMKVTER